MIYPTAFLDYCVLMESRLTSLRKCTLYILWLLEKPLKAYEIVDELKNIQVNAKPTTVYRVLDYFVACGMVHKIESIQSYTLCRTPKKQLPSELLMVCNSCHSVHEVYDKEVRTLVQKLALQNFFYLGQDAIELKGLCKICEEKRLAN